MNREEARAFLQVYRSNGADASDGRFAEALKRLEQDPELAQWFEEQKRFDASVAQGLQTITAPADLPATILASRRITRLPMWQDWRVRAAVAAAIAVLAVAGVGRWAARPKPFADFRQQLVDQAWAGPRHLDKESSDWNEVKAWLAEHKLETNFSLPPALADLRLHGCSMVEADGHRVPLICLVDGPKHLHLFVATGVEFPELAPEGLPDFEKCNGWKTASWRQNGKTFVLTGMSYQTFVSKFRKGGRWTMSG